MNTRIHYQSRCSPCFCCEPAVISEEVFVEAHLLAKPFCVESPAFDEGGVSAVASELGKIRKFLLDCDLEVVAWNCVEEGENLHHDLRPGLSLVRVNVQVSGSGPVLGRRIVVGSRCSVCPPFLDFPEIVLRFREPAEELGETRGHLSQELR